MSEVINPANSPRAAAQQVVIELIRAGKVGGINDAEAVIKIYEKLVEEYDRINNK